MQVIQLVQKVACVIETSQLNIIATFLMVHPCHQNGQFNITNTRPNTYLLKVVLGGLLLACFSGR